jgi:hypothetical protein
MTTVGQDAAEFVERDLDRLTPHQLLTLARERDELVAFIREHGADALGGLATGMDSAAFRALAALLAKYG